MSFLDRQQQTNQRDPFAKKKKAAPTKVVKINEDLHYILKTHAALENDGSTITDHINKAVEEYVKKYKIDPPKR